MKDIELSSIIFILGIFVIGCAQSSFCQTGKSIKECECDLIQCVYEVELSKYLPQEMLSSRVCDGVKRGAKPVELNRLCMQAKGYEFLDANTLPKNIKRKKVTTLIEDYWIADGLDVALYGSKVFSEQKDQENDQESKVDIKNTPEISVELKQAFMKMFDKYRNKK